MTVKVEEDLALEGLDPLDANEVGAECFSPGGEEADDEEEETDRDSDGENGNGGGSFPLKKGPWTPEEDKRLKEYVEKNGDGNWNQLRRNAGLNRCGKSCRLRWANHLRPDLKKEPFDSDETDMIINFHFMWGNKWAKMASMMPGRTDNEIKNYWNTRLKRNQRAGLPLYPEKIVRSYLTGQDMNCHTTEESRGRKRSNESSQEKVEKVIGMHDLLDEIMTFQHLDYDKDPVVPTKPLKRHASAGNLSCQQIPNETDLNYVLTESQSVPLDSAISSGYPVYGNLSASETMLECMKTENELPSFQYSEMHIPPIVHNTLSQSNAYPMWHSSVFGDIEPEGCPTAEIQASNLYVFTVSKRYLDASFTDPGIPDKSLEASFLDDSLFLKDQPYPYESNPLLDEDSWVEPKPITDGGLDSSAWKASQEPVTSLTSQLLEMSSSSLLDNQGAQGP